MIKADYIAKNRDCIRHPLTTEEIDEGWHFCPDHGHELIGPGTDMEFYVMMCNCDIPALEHLKRELRHG